MISWLILSRGKNKVKRIWLDVASHLNRLRLRRNSGRLRKLQKEVRTCKYRDVHIMWDMLKEMDGPLPLSEREAAAFATAGARKTKAAWSRFVSFCGRF